ncbi:MAG TPA: hypothetical protein PLS66_07515 [Tepiditoga sp.]|nr:hypothetical protein [Tepiditoga sp.]
MKNEKKWYKLDNAGKLYSSIISDRVTTVFRLSVYLKNNIDEKILQTAFENSMKRFPYYSVLLKKGIFWYYLEEASYIPKVQKEKYFPCMDMKFKMRGIFPLRIIYFRNRISLEFTHVITDGNGAMILLMYIAEEYLRLSGSMPSDKEYIINSEFPANDEYEDSFKKYYDRKIPGKVHKNPAFQLPFKKIERGRYNVVTGIMPVKKIIEISKTYGCSVSEFLISLYINSIYIYMKENKKKKKPIVINVPVNLRSILPSKTMRNFFISITPGIDPRIGDYTFEEIIKLVHHYMNYNINEKQIKVHIKRNVKNEIGPLKFFPIYTKNMFMPTVYKLWGEMNYTSGFSNMGIIKLSPELESFIEKLEVIPPPSSGNKIKAASFTYKNMLNVTFGKMTDETDIEKNFFTALVKMGVPVKIETNTEG